MSGAALFKATSTGSEICLLKFLYMIVNFIVPRLVEMTNSHLDNIDHFFRLVFPEDLRNVGNLLPQQTQLLLPIPFFLLDAGFFASRLEPRFTLTRRFTYNISKVVVCAVPTQSSMQCGFKGRQA